MADRVNETSGRPVGIRLDETSLQRWKRWHNNGVASTMVPSLLGLKGPLRDYLLANRGSPHLTTKEIARHSVPAEAVGYYEQWTGSKVGERGAWVSSEPSMQWLVALVDGVVAERGKGGELRSRVEMRQREELPLPDLLVHIKAPDVLWDPGAATNQPFGFPLGLLVEMQVNMHVTSASRCDLFAYAPVSRQIVGWRVHYSKIFWEWAAEKLSLGRDYLQGVWDPGALPPDFAWDSFDFSCIAVDHHIPPLNVVTLEHDYTGYPMHEKFALMAEVTERQDLLSTVLQLQNEIALLRKQVQVPAACRDVAVGTDHPLTGVMNGTLNGKNKDINVATQTDPVDLPVDSSCPPQDSSSYESPPISPKVSFRSGPQSCDPSHTCNRKPSLLLRLLGDDQQDLPFVRLLHTIEEKCPHSKQECKVACVLHGLAANHLAELEGFIRRLEDESSMLSSAESLAGMALALIDS